LFCISGSIQVLISKKVPTPAIYETKYVREDDLSVPLGAFRQIANGGGSQAQTFGRVRSTPEAHLPSRRANEQDVGQPLRCRPQECYLAEQHQLGFRSRLQWLKLLRPSRPSFMIENWTRLLDFATGICILQNDVCISKESIYVLLYHFVRILFKVLQNLTQGQAAELLHVTETNSVCMRCKTRSMI
jgi:hypothetical protein